MEYEVEGARPRSSPRKLGERLWEKTATHVNLTERLPWIVIDGGSI